MKPRAISLGDFFRAYDRDGVLHQLLGPLCFPVTDDVFLTRSGALACVLELLGMDFETANPEDIDRLWRRVAGVLHRLGPRIRVKQYLIKRADQTVHTWTEPENPADLDWIRRRAEYLRVRSLRLFFVLEYAPSQSKIVSLWKSLSLTRTARTLDERMQDDAAYLRDAAELFEANLADLLAPSLLDWRQTMRWLSDLYNPDPLRAAKVAFDRDAADISYLAANTDITNQAKWMLFGPEEGYKLRAWVMKQPPSRSLPEDRVQFPFLLRELQNTIDTNMIIALDWKPVGLEHSLAVVGQKRTIRRGQTNQGARGKEDGAAIEDVDELKDVQKDMRRSRHGRFTMQVFLFDQDATRLRRAARMLDALHWDGIFIEFDQPKERANAWLSMIPGNSAFCPFYWHWLSTLQVAELSLLFRLNEGDRENRHLKREYLSVFETPDGTPFYLSVHFGELAHSLFLGPPRSGKTALVNQLLGDARAKYGAYVWSIDLNRGYQALTERLGGRYRGHDLENWQERIALFRLEPTERNLYFLHQLVREILHHEEHEITPEEDQDLADRIKGLYITHAPEHRTLSNLNRILCPTLKGKLHRWIGQGIYAPIFDNASGEFSLATFENFDFEGLRDHPAAAAALRFYYFHEIDTLVRDRKLRHIPKVLAIDEGHGFLLDWIRDAIKLWPKMNAWVMFTTQSKADVEQSPLFFATLRESCTNVFIMPSPGADADAYGEAFHFDTRARQLIRDLVQPEFLYISPRGSFKLVHRREPAWAALYDAQNAAEGATA